MDDLLPALIIGGLVAFFVLRTGYTTMNSVRGIRNKNYLNIKWSAANDWLGQTGKDDRGFSVFSDPKYSIRAGFKILRSYAKRGVVTLRDVISTFAPPQDNNDTENYIRFVSKKTGLAPDEHVNEAMMPWVIQAMIKMEVGENVPIEKVLEGKALA